ncbi:MAG: DUF2512 family protein [Bacillota bacterium]
MRTGLALLAKFILTLVAAFIAFNYLMNNEITWTLLVALVGTGVNYLIGDLMVLPSMGNLVASIGDGIMAALTAYVIDILIAGFATTWNALVWFGILITVGEFFFHRYLQTDEKVAP